MTLETLKAFHNSDKHRAEYNADNCESCFLLGKIERLKDSTHKIVATNVDADGERGTCEACQEVVIKVHDYRSDNHWKHESRNHLGGRPKTL